jgi:hypothetical protein
MKKLLTLMALSFVIFTCDDIIEVEDISDEIVIVLAPVNDSVLGEGSVIFSWNDVQDASQYRLQLATPSFENASQILLDSIVNATNFPKVLELGDYEWRVRAENSEYQTQYTIQNFIVEE